MLVSLLIVLMIGVSLGLIIAYLYITRIKASAINTSYLEALWEVEKLILGTLNFDEVADKVTNTILNELGYLKLGYQIVVLALIDDKKGVLRRVAISNTPAAQKFLTTTPIPFTNIEISLSEDSNLAIQALKEDKVRFTNQVADVLYPVINKEFSNNLQKELGIKSSMVIPININNIRFGVLIFSMTKNESQMSYQEKMIIHSFTQAVGISIQNASLFTSLEKTRQNLVRANEKLKELDRLKDELLSIASHELRTPMTAIRSYVWMALNRPDMTLSEKLKKYLSRTLLSTERLINLVSDMLNVSRIEAGRIEISPKEFDLRLLISDTLEEVNPKADERNIKIFILEQKIPKVFADPDKSREVMLNLLGNALKYTPEGGNIIINFFTDGKVVETSVKDSGKGIAKDDLGRLFQKFGRLDNSYTAMSASGGTGLGLYISKSLVEMMNGRIWAESEGEGKGSTFTFSLPVATADLVRHQEKYHIQPIGEAKQLEPVRLQ